VLIYLQFVITKPEPTVSGGVGGVLAMLRQQGAIKTLSIQDAERERIQRERDLWLADHRRRMAKRELEKIKARGGPQKDQAQREWENKMREQQEAREALNAYKSYKPDVNIAYTDEFGRGMSFCCFAQSPADAVCRSDVTEGSLEVSFAQVPVRWLILSTSTPTDHSLTAARHQAE
jgi:U4/U6.U5 tri-snRNP-associated protein 1